MPDRLYLGVDGGQSSTTALIANEHGTILGRGVGGPCNHATAEAGRRKFLSAVGDCLNQACAEASLSPETVRFSAVCFGFSGGSEDKADYIHSLIRSDQYKLTHDGEIALTGATGGEPGIIIIAGTGSFAFGKNASGKTARSGGWGYIYGDEGGAFDLTRRALRAALQYEEGWGPSTPLHAMLLRATSSSSANDLLHFFYGDLSRSQIASYAPLVTDAAEAGDTVALGILKAAAAELVRYSSGVRGQLFRESEAPIIAFIGGVFQSRLLREEFTRCVQASTINQVGPPLYSPVFGALLEAFRLDAIKPALPPSTSVSAIVS